MAGSVATVLKVVTFRKYQNSFLNFRMLNVYLPIVTVYFTVPDYDCGKKTFDDLKSLFLNFFKYQHHQLLT